MAESFSDVYIWYGIWSIASLTIALLIMNAR